MTDNANEANLFDMPDDEFMSQSEVLENNMLAEAEASVESNEEGADDEAILSNQGSAEDSDSTDETDTGDEEGGTDDSESEDSEVPTDESDVDGEEDADGEEDSDESDDSEEDSDEDDSDEKDEKVDSELQKIFEPFKANGKMIKVDTVEEARTLMQKGANYNKKMAALKPAFKVAKMLENNELLDEDTVSYLIDLQNGNPEALKKLIKDKGIDLDSLESDEDPKYAPTTKHKVTDEELALDEVLAQVRETDTYEATMNVVGKEWDESSKSKLVSNPTMLLKLNEHMGNGVYEQISNEMARQEALGLLTGLSNLDAYFTVGQQLFQSGKLGGQQEAAPTPKQKAVDEEARKAANEQRKSKRKAAAPTKAKKPVKKDDSVNPFEMSDEEFEKQFGNSIF